MNANIIEGPIMHIICFLFGHRFEAVHNHHTNQSLSISKTIGCFCTRCGKMIEFPQK